MKRLRKYINQKQLVPKRKLEDTRNELQKVVDKNNTRVELYKEEIDKLRKTLRDCDADP